MGKTAEELAAEAAADAQTGTTSPEGSLKENFSKVNKDPGLAMIKESEDVELLKVLLGEESSAKTVRKWAVDALAARIIELGGEVTATTPTEPAAGAAKKATAPNVAPRTGKNVRQERPELNSEGVPVCLGKYPKDPGAKCRTCKVHVKCKKA